MMKKLLILLLMIGFCGVTSAGIVNGSFEDPALGNGGVVQGANGWDWLFDPYTVNDNPGGLLDPPGDAGWMAFTNHASADGDQHLWLEPTGGAIRQTLDPIAAGTTYELSFSLRGPAALTGFSWADIDLSAVEADTSITKIVGYGGAFPTVLSGEPEYVADQWYTASIQFNSDDFAQHIGKPLTVGVFGAYVAIDNMTVVPEPATMALLGFGLAMIRRKRG